MDWIQKWDLNTLGATKSIYPSEAHQLDSRTILILNILINLTQKCKKNNHEFRWVKFAVKSTVKASLTGVISLDCSCVVWRMQHTVCCMTLAHMTRTVWIKQYLLYEYYSIWNVIIVAANEKFLKMISRQSLILKDFWHSITWKNFHFRQFFQV